MKIPAKIFCAALTAVLAAGCLNPSVFRKGAFSVDDWETWTSWNDSYGKHELLPDGLYYRLTERQDDSRDEASGGYCPGLIISRNVPGRKWRVDIEADFKIPPGPAKRFSYGVWLGSDYSRPSLGSSAGALQVLAQRQNGPNPEDDSLQVFYLPGGKPFKLPADLKVLRFEREDVFFTVSYSSDKKIFTPVFRLNALSAADAPAQKFFISGFAGGNPGGAYARFTSLKINGTEVL